MEENEELIRKYNKWLYENDYIDIGALTNLSLSSAVKDFLEWDLNITG